MPKSPSPEPPVALTEADLEAYCAAHGVVATLHRLTVPTPTVRDAAAAVGTYPDRIVKSLIFVADGEPLLVVAAGESRVAYPLLATVLGVSRKRLRFATPEEALAITGYQVGSMPPFGHLTPLRTWLDERSVPTHGNVFAGGGGVSSLLELDASVLANAAGVRVAVLTRESEG